ncbi:hypothetical protein TNCV_359461 [Trichonephila clavipes]|nr:hypothetical protein TNCV_359461 [Trichonephila clavipes]
MGGCLSSDRFNAHQLLYTVGLQWYWARTHDMPATIRYLDHWATAALSGRVNIFRYTAVNRLLCGYGNHTSKDSCTLKNIARSCLGHYPGKL